MPVYLWGLPIVAFANLEVNLEGTTGAFPGDLTIYLGNEQRIFFTPNATTPYIVSYLDLAKSGPVVMDIPAGAIAGSAMDFWQRPLADLGVAGPDQGKGGKYLFVGPEQEAPKAEGAFVMRSPTFGAASADTNRREWRKGRAGHRRAARADVEFVRHARGLPRAGGSGKTLPLLTAE